MRRLVRFDPAGQAWCDKLDCWDCYRLMGIGEALEYRCLTDLCGKVVIEQGMPAWSDYVLAQRAFLVVVATEQAIVLCKAIGTEVPDVSGEVKRLVEVTPGTSLRRRGLWRRTRSLLDHSFRRDRTYQRLQEQPCERRSLAHGRHP